MKKILCLLLTLSLVVCCLCVPALAANSCPHCGYFDFNPDGPACEECYYDSSFNSMCPYCDSEFYSPEYDWCLTCSHGDPDNCPYCQAADYDGEFGNCSDCGYSSVYCDACDYCGKEFYSPEEDECFNCGYNMTFCDECPDCGGEFYSTESGVCLDCAAPDTGEDETPDDGGSENPGEDSSTSLLPVAAIGNTLDSFLGMVSSAARAVVANPILLVSFSLSFLCFGIFIFRRIRW